MARPRLTIAQILEWADAHHARTGRWPKKSSGHIWETADETWGGINAALYQAYRSLPRGLTLARLLEKHRGVRHHLNLPRLRVTQILAWADAHHRRTARWPDKDSGPIPQSPGDTWSAVNSALVAGSRGLPKGTSLPQLLARHRDVRNPKRLSRLTLRRVLAWADKHHRQTGKWPTHLSGRINGTAHETWLAVDHALRAGTRGLAGGSSLARLLARRLGVRNIQSLPDLSVEQVLRWCDAHRRRTGKWPTARDGAIPRSGGETWSGVNHALRHAFRGLPRTTLADLLCERRGVRNPNNPPRLTRKLIRDWARHHRQQTGKWPTDKSGPVLAAEGESWAAIDYALRCGGRGLPAGSSLSRLLHGQAERTRSR
jgi:hypothetical protein